MITKTTIRNLIIDYLTNKRTEKQNKLIHIITTHSNTEPKQTNKYKITIVNTKTINT